MPDVVSQASLVPDPLWFKDAIIYELHVRAFHDSDSDGIGDFRGLTQKLDFLADLGVTAIWLLPFYPSPLRDDGYDIADYMDVHSSYGTIDDFKAFLDAAHAHGLRVITELVINHTSDQHAWFQRARRAPRGSPERDFYVWSDSGEEYADARIIFKDFEPSNWSWDREANQYYWHRFYGHQPDLNFENPAVFEAVMEVLDFWMGMGVDGMRLDAVPYLIEAEHTNCENLPETHQILKRIRRRVDEHFEARMLLAEANQWPENAAQYFGDGDECHMNFHFPLMPRLFMAVQQEDRFPILDILDQTPAVPENCQWAVFLRNHDELTLEMVTDEERDYMYRTYATDPTARINLGIRRRLAPLLGNNRRKFELMNGLLFAMPGTPVLYYGDEIGMGDNFYLGDRNGVRTPMQWSGDRNAGFSRANPQRLFLPIIIDPEYHYEAINVETQQTNPSSLLWWMKRLIGLRKRYRAFGRGDLEFLFPENRKVLAFTRTFEDQSILVIANLSRFTQAVEIDLSAFAGNVPVELMGRVSFPPIGERPYFFTLGPHSFHWFALEPQRPGVRQRPRDAATGRDLDLLPALRVDGEWTDLLGGRARARIEEILPDFLADQRWYRAKSQTIRAVHLSDLLTVELDPGQGEAHFQMVRVEFVQADAETYLLPIAFAKGERAGRLVDDHPRAIIARLTTATAQGVLYDALVEPETGERLLALIARNERRPAAGEAEVIGRRSGAFERILEDSHAAGTFQDESLDAVEAGEGAELLPWTHLRANVGRAEQSNTSVSFGDALILKVYRRIEEGINQDVEIGEFLTRGEFEHAPRVAGTLSLRHGRRQSIVLGLLQEYVPNEGDAWSYTLDALGDYFERGLAEQPELPDQPATVGRLLEMARQRQPDARARELIGAWLQSAETIGERTAALHRTLAAAPAGEADFVPEPFSTLYQRSLYQSMRNLTGNVFEMMQRSRDADERMERVIGLRDDILNRFRAVMGGKLSAKRARVHGDFHLGQILFTGRDFVITDFEGEPARPASERRLKRSPLRDVAGMIRSFHYAAYSSLAAEHDRGLGAGSPEGEHLATYWYAQASAAFLRGYFRGMKGSDLIPHAPDELALMLEAYLLEKAIYEIGYELNNRPGWVGLPLRGVLQLMGAEG
ncbi:MAG TPA: maltose alpha-D-glucosyltransferase [Longimicrobiales bacterium]|nr:maltose alpha-D-glucosyltransferase [Longimicrobiales bacterium]